MNTTISEPSFLRPSMLDKLAECGHYRSEEKAGPAAERGTKMDVAFREQVGDLEDGSELDNEPSEQDIIERQKRIVDAVGLSLVKSNADVSNLDADDRGAVQWACVTARRLAGDYALEASESELRIEAEGMTGTADLLCAMGGWSADLKSGQRRSYRRQQAAYALGFMEQMFLDEWTVYLLYCDLREVETLRYTWDEAIALVREAIASSRGEKPPILNDYCGWCAKRFRCPVRRESLGIIESDAMRMDLLERLSSLHLRDFTVQAKIVAEFRKEARRILLERTVAGEKTPGVAVSTRKGSRKIDAADLIQIAIDLGIEGVRKLLGIVGQLSEAKALEAWEGCRTPFPADKVIELPGSSFVRISTPKVPK